MARNEQHSGSDPLETGTYYQQKRKSNWLLPGLAIVVTLGFLAFVGFDSYMSESGLKRIESLDTQYQNLQEELKLLQQENASLRTTIQTLKDNPQALEEVAREQLGYIKPGEKVYILSETPEPPPLP
jgi:cell division protein FtsB